MNHTRGVFIPPETADTLRDCVQRTLRAFAIVNRLRERKDPPYNTGNQLLQREARLDSLLTELFYLTAKILLPNEDVKSTLAASKKT